MTAGAEKAMKGSIGLAVAILGAAERRKVPFAVIEHVQNRRSILNTNN